MKHKGPVPAWQRSATWNGLLLGSLLLLFIAVFLYVGLLFLHVAGSTAASLSDMPALPLPQLVRPAPANMLENVDAPGAPWQLPGRQPGLAESDPEPRVTMLLMGVDARPDENVEAARTDSIMVVTVNPRTGSTGLLSLPRDMLVYVPALKRNVKINTIHVLGYVDDYPGGGPAMLKDTVADLLGYPVDYYVRVNFDGFRQIVDLVGGIDVNVLTPIDDPLFPSANYGYDPLHIPAGRIHMDGSLALKFARTRHQDSDYARAGRQQLIVMALKAKLDQPGQLAALIPRIPALGLALVNSVQTDMPVDRALALTSVLDQPNLSDPARVVVDNTMGSEVSNDPNFGFILKPDLSKLHAAAMTIFADTRSQVSPEEALKRSLQAEGAGLAVLNGGTQHGLANRMAAGLRSDGYNVIYAKELGSAGLSRTALITYGDGSPVAREALVRRFDITADRIRSEPPSPDADLALVLGDDVALGTDTSQP